MLEMAKELDTNLRQAGYETMLLVMLWWFILVASTGLSVILSWPAMRVFYPALFKLLSE